MSKIFDLFLFKLLRLSLFVNIRYPQRVWEFYGLENEIRFNFAIVILIIEIHKINSSYYLLLLCCLQHLIFLPTRPGIEPLSIHSTTDWFSILLKEKLFKYYWFGSGISCRCLTRGRRTVQWKRIGL